MGTAVPFYLHPAEHPAAWDALLTGDLGVEFAVVNVSDGPGGAVDEYYHPVLSRPRAVELVGYVDVGYGHRPVGQVLYDAALWREWYGVTGVMLDRVPAAPREGAWSLEVVTALREAGVDKVVANPGTVCDPDLVAAADVTCVAEWGWDLIEAGLPLPRVPAAPEKVWHLVHGVPPDSFATARARCTDAGAGLVYVTDATLPNPWGRLAA